MQILFLYHQQNNFYIFIWIFQIVRFRIFHGHDFFLILKFEYWNSFKIHNSETSYIDWHNKPDILSSVRRSNWASRGPNLCRPATPPPPDRTLQSSLESVWRPWAPPASTCQRFPSLFFFFPLNKEWESSNHIRSFYIRMIHDERMWLEDSWKTKKIRRKS